MMKRLSLLIVLAMLLSLSAQASAETAQYQEAPMLAEQVAAGTLPAVADRLPETPKLSDEITDEYLTMEIGNYGGTLRLITPDVNWDPDVFIGQNEAFLTMRSTTSGEITPNIVESFEMNEDNTVFTFKLRKGMKWSDGEPVTMDDVAFTINNVVFNEELTPVLPAWLRDGGSSEGDPFTFEVIDDSTFTFTFKQSYGGLAVELSVGGWKGYTELLKPSHYLKKFHIDYAVEEHGSLEAYYEFIKPFAQIIGYDDPTAEGVWMYVFNQIDMTNWELTDPNDALTTVKFPGLIDSNFPLLYGWMMESSENNVTTWVRNPYYFKVDAAGNQLPYIDRISSTYVESIDIQQLEYVSGKADFGRENATLDNISLYREAKDTANITAYVTPMHVIPTDILLNMTYGLDSTGAVKDDPDSQAWQEVVNDVRFRQALMYAVDANEILDAVYSDLGKVNPSYECTGDVEKANALLDEMGMMDIDNDGYRETPSGQKFQWQIWNANEATDIIPVVELVVDFWQDIGLKAIGYTTDSSLLSTSQGANEIPMRVMWTTTTALWYYDRYWSMGTWAPLWNAWRGGAEGGVEPAQDVKDFIAMGDSLFTVDPGTAVGEVVPAMDDWMSQHLYIIEPLIDVEQCVIINSDIGNVPTGGCGISWNFEFEQMFYR